MKIDQLPVQILMKIFIYLPRYDQVSLVNKKFYTVACNVIDSNIYLRLYVSSFNKQPALLQSIQNTNRKVSKLFISFYKATEIQRKLAISIIKKFSATIKDLRVQTGDLDMTEFLEILSLVPNADHLVFTHLELQTDVNQPTHHILPGNKDLNLHQLKTLEFRSSSEEFLVVFTNLPAGVLTELNLSIPNLDVINVIFERQTNIKKVDVRSFSTISTDIFENMKLESLMFCSPHGFNFDVSTILSKQRTLKSLSLIIDIVDEGIVNVVANQLIDLETFNVNVSKMSAAAAMNLTKFKNLKDLTLQIIPPGKSFAFLETFAKLENSAISSLNIRGIFEMPLELIEALATSVPNLKVLSFECKFDCRKLNVTMRSFNFVEVLKIRNLKALQQHEGSCYLIQGNSFNSKLTELNLNFESPYETPFLEKIIADYPNLKIFAIFSPTPLTTLQFRLILNGFMKLESFTLCGGASKLTKDHLNFLTDHKNNLKFISFTGVMDLPLRYEIEKMLSTLFEVVNVDCGLHMAVDKNTMKCERAEYFQI